MMIANPEVLGASAPQIRFVARRLSGSFLPISDEGYGAMAAAPLLLDEEATLRQAFSIGRQRRREAADSFAQKVLQRPDVLEVWRTADGPEMVVAVVVTEVSLDAELELRALFADVTHAHEATLRVYGENDNRVGLARRGESLPLA